MVLEQLGLAPERLTRRQRWMVLMAAVVAGLTRLLAVSRSLWDWDEALFSIAMRDYDVFHHHPHPPGFPLFVGLARAVRVVAESDFRALQAVTVAGALLLFPAVFLLARELRLRCETGLIAALLVVFSPNVWFFGGTSFSDVPALTLVTFACALLLRGCRDSRAYFLGAFVLALSAGFRPQNLLVGLVPALIATGWRLRQTRSIRQPLVAALLGGLTLGIAYGGAAMATGGVELYLHAVRSHGDYIRNIDSFRSPERPPLLHVFDDFFFRPYRYARINTPLALFVLIGLIAGLRTRRLAVVLVLGIFGPFALLGWLMLDRHSSSRFSIGWSPMIAILAAIGILALGGLAGRIARRAAVATGTTALLAAILIGIMISWTLPSLNRIRRNVSPPVQAVEWIQSHVQRDSKIYVAHAMLPFADLFLAAYPKEIFEGPEPESSAHRAWVLREGTSSREGARNFVWREDSLAKLVRRRYFEAAVVPHSARLRFGDGWHGEESSGGISWRWMEGRSVVLIGATAEPGELALRAYVPLDDLGTRPEISVTLNGEPLDRFVVTSAEFERTYALPPLSSPDNALVIETSEVLNPRGKGISEDGRDLGLRLDAIGWRGRGE